MPSCSSPSEPGLAGPAPLTVRKKLAFSLVVLAGVITVVVAGAELFARLKGFRPWTPAGDSPMQVKPARFGAPHPLLGSIYLPGRFVVTLEDGYSFRMTHGEDGHRITRPLADTHAAFQRRIWIFGCSYTHGWSLNDEQTYPWLVQQRMPDSEIVNFGVGGYGTLQSYLQFREALAKRPAPALAVLAYASFHDARNTLNRYRMKGINPPAGQQTLRLPCARLDPAGRLEIFSVQADSYRPW